MTEENGYFSNCVQKGKLPDLTLFREQFYYPTFSSKKILQSIKREAKFDEKIPYLTDILIVDYAHTLLSNALKPIFAGFPDPDILYQKLSKVTTSLCTNAIPIVLDIVREFFEYKFVSIAQKWSTLGEDSKISLPNEFSVRYETLPALLLPVVVAFRLDNGQAQEIIQTGLNRYSTQIFDILECFNENVQGLFPDAKIWCHIRNSDLHSRTTYDLETDTYTFRDRNKRNLDMTRFELVLLGIQISEGYKVLLSFNQSVLWPWAISIYAHELGHTDEAMKRAKEFERTMKTIVSK